MKQKSKSLLVSFLMATCLSATAALAQVPEASTFDRLVNNPKFRHGFVNRVTQEVRAWEPTQKPPSRELVTSTRLIFNLTPRNAELRQKMMDLIRAQIHPKFSGQYKELYNYMLLNLAPRDEAVRAELARLLYSKHGGYPASSVKNAYSYLNKAFNAWDKRQINQALNLFNRAHLESSSEFTAILAYHLRDAGRIGEAKDLLEPFTQYEGSYLNWIPDMLMQIEDAEAVLSDEDSSQEDYLSALILLGQLEDAKAELDEMPDTDLKAWLMAKVYEKRGRYHEASAEYQKYYRLKWQKQMPGFVPVVYKAQLEDVNSIDLIALKFRTSPELIRKVNQNRQENWIETYRMLVVPVAQHDLHWPTTGYVSSHFGYRLHPIYGTWRMHEGVDIETRPGVKAFAADKGTVTQRGYDQACGNMVRVVHSPELNTVYCHGSRLLAAAQSQVQSGSPLMVTGNTGSSASNHLHFGVKYQGQYVDPMDWL